LILADHIIPVSSIVLLHCILWAFGKPFNYHFLRAPLEMFSNLYWAKSLWLSIHKQYQFMNIILAFLK